MSFVFSMLFSACGTTTYSSSAVDSTEEYVTFAQTRDTTVRLSDVYESVDMDYVKETASNAIVNGVKSYFGFFYSLARDYQTDLRPFIESVNNEAGVLDDEPLSNNEVEQSVVDVGTSDVAVPPGEESNSDAGKESEVGATRVREEVFEEVPAEGVERIIESTESMVEW